MNGRECTMNNSLSGFIENFQRLRVLVLGEAMLDSYLEGPTGRIAQEAPVPVVSLSARCDAPGGAANTAANCRSLGAEVSFLSVIGDDAEGAALRRALATSAVSEEY